MRDAIRIGALSALVVVIWVLLEHAAGLNTTNHEIGQYTRLAGVLVPIVAIIVGVRALGRSRGADFTIGAGVRIGAGVALVQTLLTTLWFWLYGAFVNPEFTRTMLDFERRKRLLAGMDAVMAETEVARLTALLSYPNLAYFQLGIGIAYGILTALIASAVVRRTARGAARVLVAGAALALALPEFVGAQSAATGPAPAVPLFTQFSYWDHHWIQWLPRHPVFESIEAQVVDVAVPESAGGTRRLVRVFLTERAVPKRQHYYFNDSSAAATYRGGAHHSALALRMTEGSGGVPSLDLAFVSASGDSVHWQMRFADGVALSSSGSGWGAQEGHGAATTYLYRHRGAGAVAREALVRIGSDSSVYAAEAAGRRFVAGYTREAYTPLVVFGTAPILGNATRFEMLGRQFDLITTDGDGRRYQSAPFGFTGTTRVEIRTDPAGAIREYTHRQGERWFRIAFEPALTRAPESPTRFTITVDAAGEPLVGRLASSAVPEGVAFTWVHDASDRWPAWRSTVRSTAGPLIVVTERVR